MVNKYIPAEKFSEGAGSYIIHIATVGEKSKSKYFLVRDPKTLNNLFRTKNAEALEELLSTNENVQGDFYKTSRLHKLMSTIMPKSPKMYQWAWDVGEPITRGDFDKYNLGDRDEVMGVLGDGFGGWILYRVKEVGPNT